MSKIFEDNEGHRFDVECKATVKSYEDARGGLHTLVEVNVTRINGIAVGPVIN